MATAFVIGVSFGSFTGVSSLRSLGVAYFILAPLFHYFTYDVILGREYGYYNNLGFSTAFLWLSTFLPGLLVLIIAVSL